MRPLQKSVLNLLRPTANVVNGSSELPARVLRQESSTSFTVETADGTNICSLTSENPQPGQMRLKAFAADESSYYVTHISKELITVEQDSGTEISPGNEVRWNVSTGNDKDLVLDNYSYWSWLSLLNGVSMEDFKINPDSSIYIVGSALDGGQVSVLKISASGDVMWSRQFTGINNPIGGSGIVDYDGNMYVSISEFNGLTYFAKISPFGELLWQRKSNVGPYYYNAEVYSFAIDSQNNFYFLGQPYDGDGIHSASYKISPDGDLLYQKITHSLGLTFSYDQYGAWCMLPDDTFMVSVNQSSAPDYKNATSNIVRYNPDGSVLSLYAFVNADDPVNDRVDTYQILFDSESNLIFVGSTGNYPTNGGFIMKTALNGDILWQHGYGKVGASGFFYSAAIDADDNVYGVWNSNDDGSTYFTKWDTDGNLIWQKHIFNSDNTLLFVGSIQVAKDHVYLYLYTDAGDQAILRFNKIDPQEGSFTEPFQYSVTNAADDGYGILAVNVGSGTPTIRVDQNNTDWLPADFAQEDILINYEFGFQS
jgi:hypothetical protein